MGTVLNFGTPCTMRTHTVVSRVFTGIMYAIIVSLFMIILISIFKKFYLRKRSEFETLTNATSRRFCSHPVSHSINSKHEAFGPAPDLLIGLREGLGARRGGCEGSKGVPEVLGSQVSMITSPHHTSSLPSLHPHRLPWQGGL